ncbi:cyclic lactone autoinducer peptide [Candidatus Soleaferrea massiliensis]|nr:cyclic lactone autoinducer peptide [Candidatus Soleaferrea massiliensis]
MKKVVAKAVKSVGEKMAKVSGNSACMPFIIYQPKCPKEIIKK